jgi:N-methylhydantoinase A
MLRLAIDTGGTFTDCVLQDCTTGELWFGKTLSTPQTPHAAVLRGIGLLREAHAFALRDVATIMVATTVATNALLERNGAKVGLITTSGFRDVAILGRAKRYDTYDLHLEKPRPLVRRRAIAEVIERCGPGGEVITELDMCSVDAAISVLAAQRVESVAVSLLHAYANSEHERRIGQRVSETHPEWVLSLSSEVSPKYREYERTSTTLANAYVAPIVSHYLDTLIEAVEGEGFSGELYVMQSNAALLSPELARAFPVNIVESGPAAGTLLGSVIGKRDGLPQVLTFDMGGTTAKVGAIENGEPSVTTTFEVDGINLRQWSGLPLNIAAVELIEIGAGGGSIATAQHGIIEVGPRSAGAWPGPACYGHGGDQPTITDANLVLGYLVAERFAGGALSLDIERAREAIDRHIGAPLCLSLERAAWGIHAVANASMERALRSMSIERGRDPRDFAMVTFGGAGPLHACRLARALGIGQVIVPHGAGVGSAVGMLEAQPRIDASMTRILPIDASGAPAVADAFDDLAGRVRACVGHDAPNWRRFVYMRYVGQGYELRIEAPLGIVDDDYVAALIAQFHAHYERMYGYANVGHLVEATDWQVSAHLSGAQGDSNGQGLDALASTGDYGTGDYGSGDYATGAHRDGSASSSETIRRGDVPHHLAYFPDDGEIGPIPCAVLSRGDIGSKGLIGPAIITDVETTIVIPPRDIASLNATGDIVIAIARELEA